MLRSHGAAPRLQDEGLLSTFLTRQRVTLLNPMAQNALSLSRGIDGLCVGFFGTFPTGGR